MLVEKDFAARQLLGSRDCQEDYYAFSDSALDAEGRIRHLVLALADGMGGHNAGDYASMIAVDSFLDSFHELEKKDLRTRMLKSLDAANSRLRDESHKHPGAFHGMGTTLVALWTDQHTLEYISVGDSILFHFHEGRLTRLNADHSLAPVLDSQVSAGLMSQGEAQSHPDRHTLRSALLGQPVRIIDQPEESLDLEVGDILLVATDGLLTLPKSEIANCIARHQHQPASIIAEELLREVKACKHPKQDNTTVAVIKI